MRIRFLLAGLALLLLGVCLGVGRVAAAQPQMECGWGQPTWSARLQPLREALGSTMGNPVDCATNDPDQPGDLLQPTTTGLAFWRTSTGLASFTNGDQHWALTATGLVEWAGTSGDPPLHINPALAADEQPAWWTSTSPEGEFGLAFALLSQWPEGQALVNTADQHAVAIGTARIVEGHFGSFGLRERVVTVDLTTSGAPTWMVAAVLAHELRHASDFFNGIWIGQSPLACLRTEQRAFQTTRRFLTWLSYVKRPDGLPPAGALAETLPAEQSALVGSVYAVGLTPNLDSLAETAYTTACAR